MKNILMTVCAGVVLGGIALFGLYSLYSTVHTDHVALEQVVTFLNQQIQKSVPAPTAAPLEGQR